MRRVLLFVILALAACGGDKLRPVPVSGGGLRVEGGEVDKEGTVWLRFGMRSVGEQVEFSLLLHNEASVDATLSFVEPELPFSIEEAPAILRGGQQGALRVRFAPTEAGAFAEGAEIRWKHNVISLRLVGEAREDPPCELSASPAALRVTVAPNETDLAREGSVRISSTGEGICRIEAVRLEGDPSFSISPVEPFELRPGGSREIRVNFLPKAGAEGTLVIATAEGELRVPLGTKSENGCLQIKNAKDLLEVVGFGCEPGRLVVRKDCGHPLTVRASVSAGFFPADAQMPTNLQAGDSTEVSVDYVPMPPGEATGELVIYAENGGRCGRSSPVSWSGWMRPSSLSLRRPPTSSSCWTWRRAWPTSRNSLTRT